MSSIHDKWKAEADLTAAQAEKLRTESAQAAEVGAAQSATARRKERLAQAKLDAQLDDVADTRKGKERARKEQLAEERADRGTRFKAIANTVMTLGIVASLPSMLAYFLGLHPEGDPDAGPAWLMLPVPFFLELLAWGGVEGTRWARRKGMVLWPFWLMTAALASIAGAINGMKAGGMFGPVAAVAFVAVSVVGPILAEVVDAIESATAHDTRTPAERAKAKADAKTAAAEAEVEAEQDKRRRKLHPREWKAYETILAAAPTGTLTRAQAWDEARRAVAFPKVWTRYEELLLALGAEASRTELWDRAWTSVEGLPTGDTARALAVEIRSRDLAEALMHHGGETVVVERLLADIFRDADPGDGAPGGTPDGPSGGPAPTGGEDAAKAPRKSRPKVPGALGRIGKRAPYKDVEEPLAEDDLDAARKLHDVNPAAFSTPAVARVLGRSKVYAKRVRDAVLAEAEAKVEGEQ